MPARRRSGYKTRTGKPPVCLHSPEQSGYAISRQAAIKATGATWDGGDSQSSCRLTYGGCFALGLNGASVMRKAILIAFLLFGATGGWALAYDMRDRFKDAFEPGAPALPIPPAAKPHPSVPPAADPDINGPPAADPASALVPMPRPRPPHDIAPVAALPAAPASASPPAQASGGAAGPPPAGPAIKPSGRFRPDIKLEYLGIRWIAVGKGCFVTNSGEKPLSVIGVQLNNRKDCRLKPYSLGEIQKAISVEQAVKLWGSAAINLFGLPKTATGSVLIPELPPSLQSFWNFSRGVANQGWRKDRNY